MCPLLLSVEVVFKGCRDIICPVTVTVATIRGGYDTAELRGREGKG